MIVTARSLRYSDMEYKRIEEFGLSASIRIEGGTGYADDPRRVNIRIVNGNDYPWSGVIHVELPFPKTKPRFFLPAFMYGTNRGEAPQRVPHEFPRLREGNPSRPSSSWWMVRSDRLSHPAALVYDNGMIYGICASPYWIVKDGVKRQWHAGMEEEFYQYSGFSCNIDKGTLGYTLGYENAPLLFIKSMLVKERSPLGENCFELDSGESVEFTLDVYEYQAESELGIHKAIEGIYRCYHQSPRRGSDVHTVVADLAGAIHRDAWRPKDQSYAGFVFEDRTTGGYWYNLIYSLSWTNGLSVAVPVLMAALRLGDDGMRERALTFIQNVVDHSLNPASGLPYCAYDEKGVWSNRGWWFDDMRTPGHSAYLVGQAVYYLLKAYEFERRLRHVRHNDWLNFAREVLDRLEKTRNTEGEYPHILSEKTGAGLEYDSFGSTWIMAASCYYMRLTGERAYLEGVKRSENHYYDHYVKRVECYGAPLDADKAPDSEGILAYIKAMRQLHEVTGEERYLDHMRDALHYEFTFKFCYNSPIKTPPLSKIGWSSCGGSVTSVANPHIHPMSSNIVDEMLYYTRHRNDGYILQRMLDTVAWGCQTYNRYDKEFDYGKRGWMSERFCYSEGLLTERYEDGSPASTWFCLMPWASGCVIESLAGDYWDAALP